MLCIVLIVATASLVAQETAIEIEVAVPLNWCYNRRRVSGCCLLGGRRGRTGGQGDQTPCGRGRWVAANAHCLLLKYLRELAHCVAFYTVHKYVQSSDFLSMVEAMKRRERERVVQEVAALAATERATLLQEEEEKIKIDLRNSITHREILAQNQMKIEVWPFLSFQCWIPHLTRVSGATTAGIIRATGRGGPATARYPKASKRRCEYGDMTIVILWWLISQIGAGGSQDAPRETGTGCQGEAEIRAVRNIRKT